MYTFGPLIAKNSRSGRLLSGAPITVTTLDGVTLTTTPTPLVTNHEGYLPTFTADTDQRVILARPRGGDPLPLYAHEGIQDAAEAADTINTGRLSETALASTIDTRVSDGLGDLDGADTGAAGLAVLAAALPADARGALGVTIDTSVGTRVMVGGEMIYGDTGWRDVSSMLAPGVAKSSSLGRALIRRAGHRVEFIFKVDITASGITLLLTGALIGFRPNPATPLDNNIFTAPHTGAGASSLSAGDFTGTFRPSGSPLGTGVATPFPNPGTVAWSSGYVCDDIWPTSLPGSPL